MKLHSRRSIAHALDSLQRWQFDGGPKICITGDTDHYQHPLRQGQIVLISYACEAGRLAAIARDVQKRIGATATKQDR